MMMMMMCVFEREREAERIGLCYLAMLVVMDSKN
jgi:hypothetical protein